MATLRIINDGLVVPLFSSYGDGLPCHFLQMMCFDQFALCVVFNRWKKKFVIDQMLVDIELVISSDNDLTVGQMVQKKSRI